MAKDPENDARQRALERIRKARSMPEGDVQAWVEQMRAGDRTALARAISLVESHRPEDRTKAGQLLDMAAPHAGDALRYGITGVPGAGKSTWIEAAGQALIGRGHRVAVLAVDPSSLRTGGSLLGDKTRMSELARHKDAFVRPSPSGMTLGGVAEATAEIALLCEAAGFDRILIETVGVGQSETEVRRMSDLFLLLLLPGGGDGVQGIKRGILEWADAVWVNKADGGPEQMAAARAALAVYQGALGLIAPPPDGAPPLFRTGSALDPGEVGEWIDLLETRLTEAQEQGRLEQRRHRQQADALAGILASEALKFFQEHPGFPEAWNRLQNEAARTQIPPHQAVRKMLRGLD